MILYYNRLHIDQVTPLVVSDFAMHAGGFGKFCKVSDVPFYEVYGFFKVLKFYCEK